MKHTAFVVSHTHWDREWYLPFQGFRRRLVAVLDELLDLMESNPDYRYFHLDGQTDPIEDYLQIRPGNEERLRKLIRTGRILVGPWYVHPDEFLVSGESLVRNLLRGHRLAAKYGEVMKAGHAVDQFGQISQLPQIFQGFGIGSALWFRGLSEPGRPTEMWWDAPDGSRVLTIHLFDDTAYSNWWYYLRDTIEGAKSYDTADVLEQIGKLRADAARRSLSGVLLFMDGVDHAPAWIDTPKAVADAAKHISDMEISHSTLPEYIKAVLKNLPAEIPILQGEMRETNKRGVLNTLFAGTLNSRGYLKRMNQECEILLSQVAEPIYTFARLHGLADQRAFLDLAWKYLLLNQPHDSICGCSVDQVHKDMLYRFDQCRLLAEDIRDLSLRHLAERIDMGNLAENERGYLLFNPAAQETGDVIEVEVDLPWDWQHAPLSVRHASGTKVRHQFLDEKPWPHRFGLEHRTVPFGAPTVRKTIALETGALPSVGYQTLIVERCGAPNHITGSLCTGALSAENEFIRLSINGDGSLNWVHKETGHVLNNGLVFEDGGDVGDGWNYVPPRYDVKYSSAGSPARVEKVFDGPLSARFRVTHSLEIPAGIAPDGRRLRDRFVTCRVSSIITLRKGCPVIEIETTIDNTARDHILRVLFPTGIHATHSVGDTAFDLVTRPITLPDTHDWKEPAHPIWPRQSLVDLNDGMKGMALVSVGLCEYEVRDDAARTLAITLLRAFPNTVGQNGEEGGQMLGRHTFRYGLYLHAGDVIVGNVLRQADLFRIRPLTFPAHPPRRGTALPSPERHLGAGTSFFMLKPNTLIMTAIKPAEDNENVVVRFFNPTNEALEALLTCACSIREAYQLNLNEERQAPVKNIQGNSLVIEAGPRKIITIELVLV